MLNRNEAFDLLREKVSRRVITTPSEWRNWLCEPITQELLDILSSMRLESLLNMGQIISENQENFIKEYNQKRGEYDLIETIFDKIESKILIEEEVKE